MENKTCKKCGNPYADRGMRGVSEELSIPKIKGYCFNCRLPFFKKRAKGIADGIIEEIVLSKELVVNEIVRRLGCDKTKVLKEQNKVFFPPLSKKIKEMINA